MEMRLQRLPPAAANGRFIHIGSVKQGAVEGKRVLEQRHSEGGGLKEPSTLRHRGSHSTFSLKAEFFQALKGSLKENRFTVKQKKSRCVQGC